jgi:hypothetical protein
MRVEEAMRHLALLATGVFLIAASVDAGAGMFSPAGLSRAGDVGPIELVAKKSEPLKQKVKRIWRDLTGYKFEVSCPFASRSTCTETGKSRADARAKCQSRNAFCWVADTSR